MKAINTYKRVETEKGSITLIGEPMKTFYNDNDQICLGRNNEGIIDIYCSEDEGATWEQAKGWNDDTIEHFKKFSAEYQLLSKFGYDVADNGNALYIVEA